ncbi:acyl-CoA dehydrogenase [Pseudonocardia saturnea]|uniref:Acyl-CoA dehydrogenase n=1 Tax=Pseudonocardia saturnea TaxID=33909 RepID=A0ABQ0S669_9PSEU|nr:acyl-CoA dehydrogenase [Pseudonocardia autotrophica]GEC28398.1 acyl-CoA dehydrogenase [Pseudonocardia saturnea]
MFDPSAEQRSLAEAARPVFDAAGRAGSAAAPGGPDPAGDPGPPGPGWRVLGESGLFGALLPQDRGGLGLAPSELAAITEQAGRVPVPGPLVETLWVAVPALAAHDHPLLARVVDGHAVATAADPAGRAPDLDVAHAVVVPGPHGDVLLGPDLGAAADPVSTADRLERSFRLPTTAVPSGPVPGSAPGGAAAPARGPADRPAGHPLPLLLDVGAVTLGRLGGAAYLVGIAARLLEIAVEHARTRVQFGVPIGSFQAVRHRLADTHVEIEIARSAVGGAAVDVDRGDPVAGGTVTCAAVLARRAFDAAQRHCLQALGGIGFTWEHELHVLVKRGHTFAHRFGSRRELERLLGAGLLDGELFQDTAASLRPGPPPPHI